VEWAERSYRFTQRRACGALGAARSSVRYIGVRPPQEALRARIPALAAVRVSYAYPRLTVLLRREGWHVNKKRVYRLYREEGWSCGASNRSADAVPCGGRHRPRLANTRLRGTAGASLVRDFTARLKLGLEPQSRTSSRYGAASSSSKRAGTMSWWTDSPSTSGSSAASTARVPALRCSSGFRLTSEGSLPRRARSHRRRSRCGYSRSLQGRASSRWLITFERPATCCAARLSAARAFSSCTVPRSVTSPPVTRISMAGAMAAI
jgi:hypothetical protein